MIPVTVAFGVTSAVALLALAVGVWMGLELAAGRAPNGREDWQQIDDGGANWPEGCYGRGRE